jgi:hypothetical protein
MPGLTYCEVSARGYRTSTEGHRDRLGVEREISHMSSDSSPSTRRFQDLQPARATDLS